MEKEIAPRMLADYPIVGTKHSPLAPFVLAMTLLGACGVWAIGTPFMAAATIAYGLLVLGLVYRKDRQTHPVLMLSGILVDIGIVLTLEIQRNAIDTALSFTLSPLQQAHIGFSSTALLLYFPTMGMGWSLWRRPVQPRLRKWHLRIAISAFCFRTLGFLMMISFLGHGKNSSKTEILQSRLGKIACASLGRSKA